MIYTDHFDGIRFDIQTVNATISNEVHLQIKCMIRRLRRYVSEINWINISFRKNVKQATNNRTVGVRLGIPDNDVFASASGDHWKFLLRRIEEKLERQLQRRRKSGYNEQKAF